MATELTASHDGGPKDKTRGESEFPEMVLLEVLEG